MSQSVSPNALPFELTLKGSTLSCDTSLRWLPNQRLVMKGQWQGSPVAVKLFCDHTKGRRKFQREVRGINHWKNAAVTMPSLLYQGKAHWHKETVWVLVFEWLEGAKPLGDLWSTLDTLKKKALLSKMVCALANQHHQGLIHHDPHLNNFMVCGDGLYCIDAGEVEKSASKPLARHILCPTAPRG